MDIFEMISDIERVYEDLVNKEKKGRLSEIQTLKEEEETNLNLIFEKKKEYVNSVIKDVSNEIKDYNKRFEKNCDEIIDLIESDYKNNKDKLVKIILDKLGFDF